MPQNKYKGRNLVEPNNFMPMNIINHLIKSHEDEAISIVVVFEYYKRFRMRLM